MSLDCGKEESLQKKNHILVLRNELDFENKLLGKWWGGHAWFGRREEKDKFFGSQKPGFLTNSSRDDNENDDDDDDTERLLHVRYGAQDFPNINAANSLNIPMS